MQYNTTFQHCAKTVDRGARDGRQLTHPLVQLTGLINVNADCINVDRSCRRVSSSILVRVLSTLNVRTQGSSQRGRTVREVLGRHRDQLITPAILRAINRRSHLLIGANVVRVPSTDVVLRGNRSCRKAVKINPKSKSPTFSLSNGFISATSLVVPTSMPINCRALRIGINGHSRSTALVDTPDRIPLVSPVGSNDL